MYKLKKGLSFICILLTLFLLLPTQAMALAIKQHMQNVATDTPQASAQGEGVTIEVISALADAYNLFILCSMTIPDDMTFTDDMFWSPETVSFVGAEDVSSTGSREILEQNGNKRTVLYTYSQRGEPIISDQVRFELNQLARFQGDDIVPIIEGEWVLNWQVEKEDSIQLEPSVNVNINGSGATVKSVMISPMAVHILVESDDGIKSIAPVVQMRNGSIAAYNPLNEFTGGWTDYSDPGNPKKLIDSNCLFDNLIDVEDVVSVKLGDMVIPISTDLPADTTLAVGGAAGEPSVWAAQQVNEAIRAGIVPNHLQNGFTKAITREEFCALAVNLYESVTGAEITQRQSFNDTSDVNIEKMAALEVVQGVGDNQFAPERTLNREQAASMLSRLSDVLGKPLPKGGVTYADNALISVWAAMAVDQVQNAGIMSGVGNNRFDPKGLYTREQSIATMFRLYELVH